MSAATSFQSSDVGQARPLFLNTAMSLAGQAWTSIAALICLPVYVRLLGMEAFGLIGFHISLQAILRALDFGMTPTVIREIARASATQEGLDDLPSVSRTFEIVFATVGFLIAISLAFASPWIGRYWIANSTIANETVAVCVLVMGLQGGISWLSQFYQNALIGLERQVTCTVIRILEVSCSSLGAIAWLSLYDARVEVVFYWQTVVGAISLFAYAASLKCAMPRRPGKPSFRIRFLRRIWRFASGMTAITITSLLLSHMDKIVLSKCLSLREFGDYSLAFLVVSGIFSILTTPMGNVMLPRFCRLVAHGDEEHIWDLYRLLVQFLASISFPVVLVLGFFSVDFLESWTADASLADRVSRLILLIATGMMLNSLYWPAYLVQLSHGVTSLGAKVGILLVVVFGPSLYFMVRAFGTEGAAMNFAAMNAASLIVGLPLTFSSLLRKRSKMTFVYDILPSFLAAIVAFGALILLSLTVQCDNVSRLVFAIVFGVVLVTICVVGSERVRREVLGKWRYAVSSITGGRDSQVGSKI